MRFRKEMHMYERLELLLKEKGITAYKLAQDTGVSTATLTSWKQGKYVPKPEKLQKIADYFGVTLDYLYGKSDGKTTSTQEENATLLSQKDERDIAKRLEATLADLENSQEALMFSGDPLDDQTRELLKASLENSIRIAKINAKQKFTPKKYKKQ